MQDLLHDCTLTMYWMHWVYFIKRRLFLIKISFGFFSRRAILDKELRRRTTTGQNTEKCVQFRGKKTSMRSLERKKSLINESNDLTH